MPRLFVAVELPEDVKDRLAALCEGLQGARWTRDRQFHLTLRFLGEVDNDRARKVGDILNAVRADPFELELGGVGHFPPRGRPRVVWAGLRSREGLEDLHRRLTSVLKRAGFGPDERKFAAHVTLGRLDGTTTATQVGHYEARHLDFRCEPFPVTGFALFSSFLSREGALHRVEARYPLFGRTGPSADGAPDRSATR